MGGTSVAAESVPPVLARRLERATRGLIVAVGMVAVVVLVVGWWLGVEVARTADLGAATMKANTAVCLGLAAAALWLQLGAPSARRRQLSAVLGGVVAGLGALILAQHVRPHTSGIDQLFARGPATAAHPGRVAPATAALMTLTGAAVVALAMAGRRWRRVALTLTGAAALLAVLTLLGVAYDVRSLYRMRGFASISPPTAICFFALTLAMGLRHAREGGFSLLTSRSAGGIMVRRLALAVIVVPLLMGWVRLQGEEAGYFTTAFGAALVASTTMLVFGAMVWVTAARMEASEQAKRRADAARLAAFDAALDGIVQMDDAGIVIGWNAAAERLFGWTRAQATGQVLAELIVPPRLREAHRRGLARYVASGEARVLGRRIELAAVRADGSELPVELAIVADPSDGGHTFTGFLRDLGDQRRAEEERRRSLALELENRRVEEANRLKSEFLASMSHELRTPLNAIIGFTELLRDGGGGDLTPLQQEYLGDVATSGHHLLRLVNDVLDLSKVESGKLVLHDELLSLSSVAREVVSSLGPQADERGVELDVVAVAELDELTGDRGRIRQLLYNYVANAIKFTSSGGRVVIRIEPEPEPGAAAGADEPQVRLTVEDTGVGIAPDDLARLFVPFEQVRGTAQFQGTGLGLALNRRLAEAMGGHAGATSTPGVGSAFHVTLPRRLSVNVNEEGADGR